MPTALLPGDHRGAGLQLPAPALRVLRVHDRGDNLPDPAAAGADPHVLGDHHVLPAAHHHRRQAVLDVRDEDDVRKEDKNANIKVEEKEIEVIGKSLDKIEVVDNDRGEENCIDNKTIEDVTFFGWGAHTDNCDKAYLTAAASVGMDEEDLRLFVKRVSKVFDKMNDDKENTEILSKKTSELML